MRPQLAWLRIACWGAVLAVAGLHAAQGAETSNPLKRMRCLACHVGANQHVLDGKQREASRSTIDLAKFRDADHDLPSPKPQR